MNNPGSSAALIPQPSVHLQLDSKQLQIVQSILAKQIPKTPVFAFGSRVSGQPRKYSDLDLAVQAEKPLSLRTLRLLKESFEDSDLPICVDIVDWSQADASFKAMVAAQGMAAL